MLYLLFLQVAFADNAMKNYKAVMQKLKDNGVILEVAINFAVKLACEDKYTL